MIARRIPWLTSSTYGVSSAMRRAPIAARAVSAAVNGSVTGMPGRDWCTRAATFAGPITIAPDVQP